jgi:uncharacterized protein (DUF983 family)
LSAGRSASPSPYKTGLFCRCPRCGEGRLYRGVLTVAERCEACGFDLSAQDSGDGPAVFVILVLGAVVVALALVTESALAPPLWVHAVLWPPVILGGAFIMLRVLNSMLIYMQYRHRVAGFGERGDGPRD